MEFLTESQVNNKIDQLLKNYLSSLIGNYDVQGVMFRLNEILGQALPISYKLIVRVNQSTGIITIYVEWIPDRQQMILVHDLLLEYTKTGERKYTPTGDYKYMPSWVEGEY